MLPHYLIFWGMLLLTCGYALWRGNRYEQIAGAICIGASIFSYLTHSPVNARYLTLETSDLAIDTAVLLAFVAIALRSDRFWPLWVAGLQLTISMSHFFKAVDVDLMPRAYAAAERFWSYPTLVIIAVGAWRAHRRRREERTQIAA
jgi:hypothetical protein